jgi:hypothetical protein
MLIDDGRAAPMRASKLLRSAPLEMDPLDKAPSGRRIRISTPS